MSRPEIVDPLAEPDVAVRQPLRIGRPIPIRVGHGHLALLSFPDGSYRVLGPGSHELPAPPSEICWMSMRPVEATCVLPATEARTEDGYCVGLLCRLALAVWEPKALRDALGDRMSLGEGELKSMAVGLAREALAKALLATRSGEVGGRLFEAYLRHWVNVALGPVGLRARRLKVEALAKLGPVSRPEDLLELLRGSFRPPVDPEREKELRRKARMVRERPWLLAKPLDPNWASEWRAFWAGMAEDLMWARGKFLLRPGDLSDVEPFSSLRPEWREEVFEVLRGSVGSRLDAAFSREILRRFSSSLAQWARENGLFELDLAMLEEILGLEADEALAVLEELVWAGACSWLEKGKSAVLKLG
ncbi:hypothetical protein DRO32_01630 [Candidatus Bathyarchaeota archaeon]|nr:MAG: hypothetical protein DRO32_01630 [Candidatus Bathyarchaeota archaeon]